MRTKNVLLNISGGIAGQACTLLLGFIVRTVFIYKLGAEYLGISGLFSNILAFLSLAELGIGQAIIYALYKPIAEQDEYKCAAYMNLFKKSYHALFCIILILGSLLIPFIDSFISGNHNIKNLQLIYILYLLSSASTYLFSYKTSFLIAEQKNYIASLISIICSIFASIIQIGVLIWIGDFIAFLVVQICSTLLTNAIISKKTSKLFPFIDDKSAILSKDAQKDVFRNIKALSIYKLGTYSLNSTDNIIIAKFVSLVAVGCYSNYLLIQSTVTGLASCVFSNMTASIGNFNATNDNESKFLLFNKINLLTFWVYSIISISLYICMNPFIQLWIGEEYLLPKDISLIIAINVYIAGMLYSPFNYRQTMGLFIQGKIRPVISAVLNIVLSIILVIHYGIAGVLWGTAITRILTNVWYDPYIVFKKGLKLSPFFYFKDYIIKAIILCFIFVSCIYIAELIPDHNIYLLIFKAFTTVAIINILLFISHIKSNNFWNLFHHFSNYYHQYSTHSK